MAPSSVMNRLISLFIVAVFGSPLLAPPRAEAQSLIPAGHAFERTVSIAGADQSVHGLTTNPGTGDVYFIGQSGESVFHLATDGTLTKLFDTTGNYVGILTDLDFGPDGLLYAGHQQGGIDLIHRYDPINLTGPTTFAAVTGGDTAFGGGFDCDGNYYTSDSGNAIYRITPMSSVSTWSTDGWGDVEDITPAGSNEFLVTDGNPVGSTSATIFLTFPDGTRKDFATLAGSQIYSSAVDRVTGDVYVGSYSTGIVYRLRDADGDRDAQGSEVTQFAVGFGTNSVHSMAFGPTSDGGGGWSLYLGTPSKIFEINGFSAPTSTDCGDYWDDDGDGICELGEDVDQDGYCETIGSGTLRDCDDNDADTYEGAPVICSDSLKDNDCDGNDDLAEAACAAQVDMDGDGYCTVGSDDNDNGFCENGAGRDDCDDNDSNANP
ncbi:MAG: putative metal-binding motif-containing protein, partial [Myxococcales bacterium]|nr:putative metal-binding motif-containing protein [Myxococcales bacterium]